MANAQAIELATLPVRHPKTGAAFLKQCGAAFVLRLGIDPTAVQADVTTRAIVIDRQTPRTAGERVEEKRDLGWSGAIGVSADDCTRLAITFSERRITEDAALAVMALLIHELEGITVEEVVQIGSGGDYLLSFKKHGKATQVEASGIREDESGGRSSARLTEKCAQVLQKVDAGFASVTTFRRLKAGVLHSYLHYVEKQSGRPSRTKKGKRRKRK